MAQGMAVLAAPAADTRERWTMSWLYPPAVAGLAVLTGLLAIYPVVRAFAEVQVNYNEGWNLLWQQRIAQGLPLYSGHADTLLCNYPPLSFWLIGGLGALGVDMNLAARLISLLALGAIAAACVSIVRRLGAGRLDGVLAATAFALPMLAHYDGYVGVNDPQLLGLAFAAVALAVHLGEPPRPWRSAAVALLLVAAVFTKHNLIALPAVIALDTLWRGDWRARVAFVAAGAVASAALLAAIWAVEGSAFFDALLAPREWSGARAADYIVEMIWRHSPVLALAAAGLAVAAPRARLLVGGYCALSFALAAYFAGGAGTAENIWFDLLLGIALGAGLAAAWIRRSGRWAWLAPAVAVAVCLPVTLAAPRTALAQIEALSGGLAREEQGFAADAAFLRSHPGPVLCESLLLCLKAGKQPQIDPFNAYQATRTGRLPPEAVSSRVAVQEFAVIQIRSPRGRPDDRFRNFGPEVYDALALRYRPARHSAMGTFSLPR